MARNLIKAGNRVIVCDRSAPAVAALKQAGAAAAESPAELASTPGTPWHMLVAMRRLMVDCSAQGAQHPRCRSNTQSLSDSAAGLSAVITMLPSIAAVRETYLGADGILSVPAGTLRPWLLVDSSTIDPHTSAEVAAASQEARLHPESSQEAGRERPAMLDAPVSGGVPGAAAGTLTFMVGGEEAALRAARPLFEAMGRAALHCGAAGAGQAAKLCNNLVRGISMAGVAEGLALGQRLGLDPARLTEIFNGSSARCWSSDTYNPVPVRLWRWWWLEEREHISCDLGQQLQYLFLQDIL